MLSMYHNFWDVQLKLQSIENIQQLELDEMTVLCTDYVE